MRRLILLLLVLFCAAPALAQTQREDTPTRDSMLLTPTGWKRCDTAAVSSGTDGDLTIPCVLGTGYLPVTISNTLATDATHDAAAIATGPNIMGECDDTATDAVDEGDAGRARIDCATRALRTTPTGSKLAGATPVTMKSDNTNNDDETAICTGPCTIYSVVAFNHAAAAAFLRCENDTTGNTTPGSETNSDGEPEFEIPGSSTGAGFVVTYPVGISFSVALTCWIATGEAATDTTDAATDDVAVHFSRVQ